MWEYEIEYICTGEVEIICGYTFVDACLRNNIDPNEVVCLDSNCID